MTVTAAVVRRDYLEPALDARALNLQQAYLIANPATDEPDSLVEVLDLLHPDTHTERAAHASLRQLAAGVNLSNAHEGLLERAIAGCADTLATDLRRIELNGGGMDAALTAKGIARRLREPLRVLAHPSGRDAAALVNAVRTLHEVLNAAPDAQLRSPAVAHELGAAKARVLHQLIERESNGAEVAYDDPGPKIHEGDRGSYR